MLTNEQLDIIIDKIKGVLNRKREPLQILNEDEDPDYKKGRSEQQITRIIYNVFQPANQDINGVIIHKRKYGNDMTLPELHSEDNIYQLYNHTAEPYNTEEVKHRVQELGEHFYILEFTVSDKTYELTKFEAVSFAGFTEKGRAKIRERRTIWPTMYNCQ